MFRSTQRRTSKGQLSQSRQTRLKWYDGVRQFAIDELIKLQIISPNWRTIMKPEELTNIILETAKERLF
eukprot:8232553-Heterocapsa_arctica.AAC.1